MNSHHEAALAHVYSQPSEKQVKGKRQRAQNKAKKKVLELCDQFNEEKSFLSRLAIAKKLRSIVSDERGKFGSKDAFFESFKKSFANKSSLFEKSRMEEYVCSINNALSFCDIEETKMKAEECFKLVESTICPVVKSKSQRIVIPFKFVHPYNNYCVLNIHRQSFISICPKNKFLRVP